MGTPLATKYNVVAGLVPAIHVFLFAEISQDMDARHKAGHDESTEKHAA